MGMPWYVGAGICVIILAIGAFVTSRRNKEIRARGIETDAVVTRIEEDITTDGKGSISGSFFTYYVEYKNQDGKTVEAKLGSGTSIDNQIGGPRWAEDLQEGSAVRIRYLPDKPFYVIRA